MSLADLLELEVDELEEVAEFARERDQHNAWGNVGELLAKQTELLAAILARLNAGVPVVLTKRPGKVRDPYEVERPPWMAAPATTEQVMTPRGFFQMMQGR
ncbi:hypothetical protein GCM10027418_06670 [Mariniluteicoccus endophyticus]